MLVEGETTARIGVVAERCVSNGQILHGGVGDPHGVGGEILHCRGLPNHVDGCAIVFGVVEGHQGRNSWRRGALADDVLERCGGHQHDLVGVAVEPNVVSDHTNGVDLTVDERDTVQGGDDGLIFIAWVHHGGL